MTAEEVREVALQNSASTSGVYEISSPTLHVETQQDAPVRSGFPLIKAFLFFLVTIMTVIFTFSIFFRQGNGETRKLIGIGGVPSKRERSEDSKGHKNSDT